LGEPAKTVGERFYFKCETEKSFALRGFQCQRGRIID